VLLRLRRDPDGREKLERLAGHAAAALAALDLSQEGYEQDPDSATRRRTTPS
jgi:hypothetical protein